MDELLALLRETGIPYAYDHFAEGEAPDPPFICYLLPGSDNRVWMLLVKNGNGVSTDYFMKNELYGGKQIKVLPHLNIFHELNKNLRICITTE